MDPADAPDAVHDPVPAAVAAAATPRDPAPTPGPRSSVRIGQDLAEANRFLREAPPHHGSGTREALGAKVAALERELAAARAREARTSDAPADPTGSTTRP